MKTNTVSRRDKVVYLHKNIKTGKVFYVGIGSIYRPHETTNRNRYWRNYTKKYGFDVEIINTGLSSEDAKEIEIELIEAFGRRHLGGQLVNFTSGGDKLGRVKGIPFPSRGNRIVQYTLEGEYVATHETAKYAAISVGAKQGSEIIKVCKGVTTNSKGYIWLYETTDDNGNPSPLTIAQAVAVFKSRGKVRKI